jgi:hypothetical protein
LYESPPPPPNVSTDLSGPGPPHCRDFTIKFSDTPHSVGFFTGRVISLAQRPLPEDNTQKRETSMSPAEFEPTIPASERPQTNALDRAATRVGNLNGLPSIKMDKPKRL